MDYEKKDIDDMENSIVDENTEEDHMILDTTRTKKRKTKREEFYLFCGGFNCSLSGLVSSILD